MTGRFKVIAFFFVVIATLAAWCAFASSSKRQTDVKASRDLCERVKRLYANGDYESIEGSISPDTKVTNTSIESITILAKSLYLRDEPKRASALLERIITKYPHATEAALWLARIRLAENEPREAEKAILGALPFNDNDSRLLSLLSSVYERLGDFPLAIHYGTLACSFSDELAASELRLGRIYLRMGELEGARAHVHRAKRLSSEAGSLRSAISQIEAQLSMEAHQ